MYLSGWDRYWSKYAYQFGNLLCRILTGYNPHQEHKYRWLADSICEAASLYALRRISETWVERPPRAVYRAKEFAPSHEAYATRIERDYALAAETSIRQSLRQDHEGFESSRQRNDLVGTLVCDVLEIFQNAPDLWRDCAGLASCDARPNETLEDYLDTWSRAADRSGRGVTAPDLIRKRLGL